MRISMRLRAVLLASVVLVVVLVFGGVPVSAGAVGSPWWHVTAEPVPTYLHSGLAANEVDELTVSATEGEIILLAESSRFTLIKSNVTAAELRQALETLYPARAVTVTGGPGNAVWR